MLYVIFVTRYQPVDSAHSLSIVTRVPRGIEYDHTIGSDKIDAKTSGSGRDEEQFDFGVGIKVVNEFFSLQSGGAAV